MVSREHIVEMCRDCIKSRSKIVIMKILQTLYTRPDKDYSAMWHLC